MTINICDYSADLATPLPTALCFLPTEAWAVHYASPAVEVSRRNTQPDGPGVLLS